MIVDYGYTSYFSNTYMYNSQRLYFDDVIFNFASRDIRRVRQLQFAIFNVMRITINGKAV